MDITLDALKKRKCILCGHTEKTFSNVMLGQVHIATVSVCCNCGLTLTFSHSADEYAKYIESAEFDYKTEICSEYAACTNKETCPRIKAGRKI